MERDESLLADDSYTERAGANGSAAQVELRVLLGYDMMMKGCWAEEFYVHPAAEGVGTMSGFGDSSGEIQTHCSVSFLNDLNDGKVAGNRFVGIWVRKLPKSVIM